MERSLPVERRVLIRWAGFDGVGGGAQMEPAGTKSQKAVRVRWRRCASTHAIPAAGSGMVVNLLPAPRGRVGPCMAGPPGGDADA